jgi:hypothetical protein
MPTMVMTDPRTDRSSVVVDRAAVAARRQDVLLTAVAWWRLEARLAEALEFAGESTALEAPASRIAR